LTDNRSALDNRTMIQRSEGYFRGYNDFELFYQTWKGANSRGTLVVTHGLGEHSEAYTRLAEGVVPGDWDLYAWDLRGHGRSEGERGVIRAFSDYCEDLRAFADFVKKQNPGKPLVLIGHSMGGLITTTAVIKFGDMGAKSLCLSSPLFGIAVQVPPLKEKFGKFAANLLPNLTLHNELNFADLSHDPKMQEEYEKDILRHDRISTKLFVEILENMAFCLRSGERIKLPFLMQLAGADRIASSLTAQQFFEKVASQNKELKVYDNYFHEIFNELGRETVFSDLKAWLKQF
jgi:alpha-beta hydrolase superfamily lysophospholipase